MIICIVLFVFTEFHSQSGKQLSSKSLLAIFLILYYLQNKVTQSGQKAMNKNKLEGTGEEDKKSQSHLFKVTGGKKVKSFLSE